MAIVGGSTLGLLVAHAGVVVHVDRDLLGVVAVLLTLAYSLREAGLVALPALDRIAAVPFSWRQRYGAVRASWLYGLALGFGFTARTPFTSFHLMLVWLFIVATPATALVIGALYGATRGIVPLFAAAITLNRSDQADRLVVLAADMGLVHLANGAALAFIGSAALIGLLR
jgi:hypothetical protein